jgi:hypothetical protein
MTGHKVLVSFRAIRRCWSGAATKVLSLQHDKIITVSAPGPSFLLLLSLEELFFGLL